MEMKASGFILFPFEAKKKKIMAMYCMQVDKRSY
jgi:hypothetical protein